MPTVIRRSGVLRMLEEGAQLVDVLAAEGHAERQTLGDVGQVLAPEYFIVTTDDGAQGIAVQEVMTDNGSAGVSRPDHLREAEPGGRGQWTAPRIRG